METKTIEIPVEFKRLFDDDWREAAVYGGRFSLKSHTVARFLLIRAREKKTRVACLREFQSSIAESSHQLLRELIIQYELTDFQVTNNAIINRLNGSDFLFKGLFQNEQNIKSTEGIDLAWVEEAQTISQESLEILTPTVRKKDSKIIYTYNRLLEDDPVHNRLVVEGRPNTLVININYDSVLKYGFIPEVILREIEDDKERRPTLYKHKWLGEPYSSERRIYRDWAIIPEIPHEAQIERTGLDFGYSNDFTAAIDIYYYNGGYIWDLILYQKGLSNKQIADVLVNRPHKALVVADSAEPKSIDEIHAHGVNIVGVAKTRGESKSDTFVKWSIGVVQNSRISITARSVEAIKEYRNLLWLMDKDGKILNEEDPKCRNDAMSAGRYGMVSLAPVIQRKERQKQVAKDYKDQKTKRGNPGF